MRLSMNRMFVIICCGLLSALLARPVLAGSGDDATAPARDLTSLSLEELMKVEVATVYSASKFEQKVTEAPSSVSIVTADEIKKYGYRTLAEILGSLRSFYITYDRNYNYVGVRGFGRAGDYNSRILLLVDGHRSNDNLYDSASIGTEFPLDVDLIDRVEVIRGPGSSLYGSNAFFAVINVITRRGKDLKGAEISAETGSYDTYKGRVTWGDSFKSGMEALVSGTLYDSDGDRLFFKEFADAEHNNGVTSHTDYDRFRNALAKLSFGGFTLEGAYSSRTKGIPTGSFDTDFNDRSNRTTDGGWFTDLKYERKLGNGVDVTGRLFYDAYDYKGISVTGGAVSDDQGHGRWWGGEAQVGATLFARHKIILGTEYRDNIRQDQKTINVDPFETLIDDKRNSSVWALYLQDEFTIFSNLILNAGLRYDHYSTFGNTLNPRLGLIYTLFEGSVLKFIYGSAFRSPNVYELYYNGLGQKGNPDLGPEKIKTYELIFEQYMGRNLCGALTGFYYTIDGLIVQMTDTDGLLVYKNLNNAEAKGIEAELEGKWESGWTGRASYSYQDARDGDTGQTLVNSPRHLAKLNLTAPLMRDKLFLGIEEQLTDRRKTLAGRYAKLFFVTNLTLFSRNLLKDLELSASLYNLFDYRYGDPGGEEHVQDVIQQDGRTFRVKLTYRL
jgi:outer membrane receptor for ferrienterochelin and colicins